MSPYEKLRAIRQLVNEQAKDEALWNPYTKVVAEAYLQRELRKLHQLVEDMTDDLPS